MQDRLVRLSKYLAKYLRHAPHELGLTLQPGGWVPVDDLLAAARSHGFPISYDDLVECVETNDKQRFAFDVSGELILRQPGSQRGSRPATGRAGTARVPLPRHGGAVPAVDLERRAHPGQAAPRASVEGRGDRDQGRGEAGQAGDPQGRCWANAP